MLAASDLAELIAFRHALHRQPEVSGHEAQTARAVLAFTADSQPDDRLTDLGGHGVALVYRGATPGPTVLIRSELDALPIAELSDVPHRSQIPGTGHLCGHDGHSTILAGLARLLGRQRPASGRVVLLFQPAEEDGSGAAAVLADPRFAQITPDYAFALHNLPGLPLGHVVLEQGPANCASVGLKLALTGKTSHAAEPHKGISPAQALAQLIPGLMALGQGGALTPEFRLVTLTHAQMGAPAFGITPGHAELWATLRTLTDAGMAALRAEALTLAQQIATAQGLTLDHSWHDDFAACTNDPVATGLFRAALMAEDIPLIAGDMPLRASEDFGRFGAAAHAAMAYFGAGEHTPALHNPDYDFPDALIASGIRAFHRLIHTLLG
ncbi:amidohydrolase [Gemmobacter fulvus]|uniref:amidohydrolase n=1 Tax=Gemmobacter fulvus TaxID=2840474 RepID=UPI002796B9A2|nr:amidohydrolase [Gemmobacter fulvus]MDQ1849511.1 amidohydrolase [Gemmobacter fulvus]